MNVSCLVIRTSGSPFHKNKEWKDMQLLPVKARMFTCAREEVLERLYLVSERR